MYEVKAMEYAEWKRGLLAAVSRPKERSKGICRLTHAGMAAGAEDIGWLDKNALDSRAEELPPEKRAFLEKSIASGAATLVNTAYGSLAEWKTRMEQEPPRKKRVHLLALGDVGSTVLTALKLLGGDCIACLGIYDVNETPCRRWECELNQAAYPWDYDAMPPVEILREEELFACDVFVFCASKGIPPVGSGVQDVRMAQYEANKGILSHFAQKAAEKHFRGLFAVVSDPVDPLCRAAFLAAGGGLLPEQIQGYGLGVMNARAAYYAKKDARFASFLTEGRAYGPHGADLVIANSVERYDDTLSRELTQLAVEANMRTRELGFKPYVAPAISSAAISLLLTLRGEWHYSSNFLGGIYMGCKNRLTPFGLEIEALPLPEPLFARIRQAAANLEAVR